MLSILIPSRNETFLSQTIRDILAKADGNIEVIAVLDGYSTDHVDEPRVSYIQWDRPHGMRSAINAAAAQSRGDYLMKLDAHCMVDNGFDIKLTSSCLDNTVVIPRRKRLDADNWCIQHTSKPDVDYEYLSCPSSPDDWNGSGMRGKQWNSRTLERRDKEEFVIDENMSFQGSCWVMRRSYFDFLELMDETNYGIFGKEAQEIGLKAWLSGGRILTNKATWYAHLHKGKKFGRGYRLTDKDREPGRKYVIRWLSNSCNWEKQTRPFSWLIEHFNPVPTWPGNWKERFPLSVCLPPCDKRRGSVARGGCS